MGEGESLNEMVRAAGGYADPAIATTTVNALMMAGERQALRHRARSHLIQPLPPRHDRLPGLRRRQRWRAGRGGLRAPSPAAALVQSAASGQPAAGCRPGRSTGRPW